MENTEEKFFSQRLRDPAMRGMVKCTGQMVKLKFAAFVIAAFLLWGCLPNSNVWVFSVQPSPAATQTFTPSPTATRTPPATATVTPTFIPPSAVIERVLIVSFDGLRPDAIELAPMKNLLSLMENGAYSLTAQTVFPSTTLPAHSSMLGGVCVAKHHVIWNDYIPVNGYARTTDIFDLAHAAGLKTVMIVGQEKLRQVTEPQSTDVFEFFDFEKFDQWAENNIIARAVQEVSQGFDLMFVHLPSGERVGHKEGWLSRMQLSTFRKADGEFGELLTALAEYGLRASTLIIVTSDHGGHETTHGLDLPEDMTIPWIASGAGIQPQQLTTQIYTMDTAATAAYALGLTIPKEWDGVAALEAFGLPVPERESAGCR